jgi:hypothetical protein
MVGAARPYPIPPGPPGGDDVGIARAGLDRGRAGGVAPPAAGPDEPPIGPGMAAAAVPMQSAAAARGVMTSGVVWHPVVEPLPPAGSSRLQKRPNGSSEVTKSSPSAVTPSPRT